MEMSQDAWPALIVWGKIVIQDAAFLMALIKSIVVHLQMDVALFVGATGQAILIAIKFFSDHKEKRKLLIKH